MDLSSDDEADVSQRTGARIGAERHAPVSVSDDQPARKQSSTAPRVRVIDDVDDADIWAEVENPQPASAPTQEQSHEPDDFEDWFALDDAPVPSSTSGRAPIAPNKEPLDLGEHGKNVLSDGEIDALFAHMDEGMGSADLHLPLPTEDDFEDMYN